MTKFRIIETPGPGGGLAGREVIIEILSETDGAVEFSVPYIQSDALYPWEDRSRKRGYSMDLIQEIKLELGKKPR